MTEVYVYDHVRTPRGKGRADGTLNEITPVELARQPLDAIGERKQASGERRRRRVSRVAFRRSVSRALASREPRS